MNLIINKFKKDPTLYFAASIVASWAGVGSLMNFKTLATDTGAVSAIIWALGNTFACILFGILIDYIPEIRRIMKTKIMFYFIGFLTIFQIWTQLTGITEVFSDTAIGVKGGMIISYAVSILFIILLIKHGMIRNVLTDGASWILVYGLLLFVAIASFIYTNGAFNHIELGADAVGFKTGIVKGLLLLPGPFTYPYFYSIYEYNEANEDGTNKANIKKSFILAGVMFGVYMIFAALLTWVSFSPVLNFIKAVLITVVAISSLSTYLYSEYLVFGKKAGLAINIFTVAGWYFLIPLGVMGIWTLMSEIRWIIVLGVIIVAIFLKIRGSENVRKKAD